MADIILHSEPYGAMLLAPEVPCLIVAWYSFANSAQFRSLMNRGLELYADEATRTQPLGWLADTRGVSAIRSADQEWLEKDWNPRAYAAGIRHVSFVVPKTVFGQMAVNNYSDNAAVNPTYAITPDQHRTLAEAKAWLHNELLNSK